MSTLDKICGVCGGYFRHNYNETNVCVTCLSIKSHSLNVKDFKLRKFRFNSGQSVDIYDIVEKESRKEVIESTIRNADKRKLKRTLRVIMYGNLCHLIK